MSEEYGGPRRAEGPHTPQAVEARHSYAPSETGTTGEATCFSNEPADLIKRLGWQVEIAEQATARTAAAESRAKEYLARALAAEAEVAALKRDAERYQAIADETGAQLLSGQRYAFVFPDWLLASTTTNLLKGSVAGHLDSHIDKARRGA